MRANQHPYYMGNPKILKPKQRRYEKQCGQCGTKFICDGKCDKPEYGKIDETACFCDKCFRQTWAKRGLCKTRTDLAKGITYESEVVHFD